jgi:hypothetical protein
VIVKPYLCNKLEPLFNHSNNGRLCDHGSQGKKDKAVRYTPWKRLGEMKYSSYSFSTSALDGGEWSALCPGRAFTPGERTPGTHCTGDWVGPRAGLDTEDRGKILSPLPGIEPRSPGRPARSQTLY